MDKTEVITAFRPIKFSGGWLLALLTLVAIAPLYALPESDFPIILLLLLLVYTGILFWIAEYVLHNAAFALEFSFFIFIFQNILLGLFNPARQNPDNAAWLLGYTALLPVMAIGIGLLRGGLARLRVYKTLHLCAALYMLYLAIQLIISPMPLSARIPAFRNASSVLLLFYAGYLRPGFHKKDAKSLNKFFLLLILAVLIFGYIELFLLNDFFWVDWLHVDYIVTVKNLSFSIRTPAAVPSDFYTFIGQQFYRRMVSLFATPVTLGYFLGFAFFFTLYLARLQSRWGKKRLMTLSLLLLILAASFLTLSKGGWQIMGVGLVCYVAIKKLPFKHFSQFLALAVFVGILSTVVGAWLFAGKGTTYEVHTQGLVASFKTTSGVQFLVGNFLGSGGTVSARLGADIPFESERGAENGIGTLFYQTGLIGVALCLATMLLILRALFQQYRRLRATDPYLATFLLITLSANVGLLANAFFQENAFSLIPASFYYIFAGVALNQVLSFTNENPSPMPVV